MKDELVSGVFIAAFFLLSAMAALAVCVIDCNNQIGTLTMRLNSIESHQTAKESK